MDMMQTDKPGRRIPLAEPERTWTAAGPVTVKSLDGSILRVEEPYTEDELATVIRDGLTSKTQRERRRKNAKST